MGSNVFIYKHNITEIVLPYGLGQFIDSTLPYALKWPKATVAFILLFIYFTYLPLNCTPMFSKLFNLLISCFALSESVFLVHAVACKAKQIGSID